MAGDPTRADPSLANGLSGCALGAAALQHHGPALEALARSALRAAFEVARVRPLAASLWGGFVGVAYVADRVIHEDVDPNVEVDRTILELLRRGVVEEYDLIDGLAGIAVYTLARPETAPLRNEILEAIVARLEDLAMERGDGYTWGTPPARPGALGGASPYRYNLGMAHGVPGVMATLAAIWASSGDPRAAELAKGASRWILAQESPKSRSSRFPTAVDEWGLGPPGRTAWCYGDPGVAAALLQTAKHLHDVELLSEAGRIGAAIARRPFEATGIVDAGLCHGAGGIALVMERFAAATGDVEFAKAEAAWRARALKLYASDERKSGYLNGELGVALAVDGASRDRSWLAPLCLAPEDPEGPGRKAMG